MDPVVVYLHALVIPEEQCPQVSAANNASAPAHKTPLTVLPNLPQPQFVQVALFGYVVTDVGEDVHRCHGAMRRNQAAHQ